jgi:hypothetical protein
MRKPHPGAIAELVDWPTKMQTLRLAWGKEALNSRYGGVTTHLWQDYMRSIPGGATDIFAAGVSIVMFLCELTEDGLWTTLEATTPARHLRRGWLNQLPTQSLVLGGWLANDPVAHAAALKAQVSTGTRCAADRCAACGAMLEYAINNMMAISPFARPTAEQALQALEAAAAAAEVEDDAE